MGAADRTVGEAASSAAGVLVLALKARRGTDYVFNPPPQTVLSKEDVLVVMGRADEVQRLQKSFS